MMKKCFVAALATVGFMLLNGCSTDDGVRVYTEEEKLKNAAA